MSKKIRESKRSALSAVVLLLLVLGGVNLAPLGVSTALASTNVALGKTYTSSAPASASYPDTNGVELTDGDYAPTNGS